MLKKTKRKYLKRLLKYKNKNYRKNIIKQNTLKKAHSYCKINKLSGQMYGPLIEGYIIYKYNLVKNKSTDCIGDCSKIDPITNNKINYEIKVSLGGSNHNQFNYVQLRLNHNINYYILTAYYLSNDNINNKGDLYVFIIDKDNLKDIILKYGHYAHGTINKNGKRTFDEMNDDKSEYALRPKYNDSCWNELLKFQVDENNIFT